MPVEQDDAHINIVDFRARTDRTVYILENQKNGYFVINNNPEMREYAKVASGETIRGITVGRMGYNRPQPIDADEIASLLLKGGVAFEGFDYEPFRIPGARKKEQPKGFNKIQLVCGTIQSNDVDSYTTGGIEEIGGGFDRRKLAESFSTPVLNSLEHFLVPKNIADMIRKRVSQEKHPELYQKML